MPRFFFANGFRDHKEVSEYVRKRFTKVYGGNESNKRPVIQAYKDTYTAIEEYVDHINKLIYQACDGRPSDMQALGNLESFIELLVILDNFLQKVEQLTKQYDKFTKDLENKNGKR